MEEPLLKSLIGIGEISESLNKNVTTIKLSLYHLVEMSIVTSSGTIKNKRYSLSK